MNIRVNRPSPDRVGLGTVIKSATPIMKGANAIASRGKAVAPSRITNSSTPAMSDAKGAATTAIVVKARTSGVVAPSPMMIATNDSDTSELDQPQNSRKVAASRKQMVALIPPAAAMR